MATTETSRPAGAAYAAAIKVDKGNRDRGRSLAPLRYLWPYVARYPGQLVAFLVFLALSAVATLVLPAIFRVITDCGFGDGSAEICRSVASRGLRTDSLAPYFQLAIVFAVIFSVVGALRAFFISRLGQRVVADIRRAVFDHLIGLDAAYFERVRTGEVLSRLTTDTTLIETVVTGSVSFALRSIVTAVGSIVLMFVVSWQLALMVMAIGPIIILPAVIVGKRLRRLSRDGQDRLADASARASEAIGSIQTVQAYTREDFERARFGNDVERTFDVQRRRIIWSSGLTMMIFAVSLTAMTGVLWAGAEMVRADRLTGGQIGQFALYAFIAVSNVGFLNESWVNFLRAAGASERIVDILNAESAISGAGEALADGGALTFDGVTFSYPTRSEARALHNVSFTVEPGKTVALVGPSGAGKTTVFQLLLRFYDPQSGMIRVDGQDISDLSPASLRRKFAVVQQDTPLFSGSARENIRYGRDGASDADVEAAAHAAFAHDFIAALPDGYDTDLGERATTLSGGQKQRIAIARAILRDAPVLLLDEATSALDAESERAVQLAFAEMSAGRTTLVIAHRLATVRGADWIIVMDAGGMVAQGTHQQLLAQGGLYADLAALQFES